MTYVIFGDSIGVGQYVSPHLTWVHKLSEYLHPDLVVNSSRNGDTTRLALERMPQDVQAYKPDVLIVQFGINDQNKWKTNKGMPRVTKESFEHNLKEILYRAMNNGCESIYLLTNHIYGYNENIRTVVKETSAKLIDVGYETPFSNGILLDDIHLNKKGHQLYFDIISKQL